MKIKIRILGKPIAKQSFKFAKSGRKYIPKDIENAKNSMIAQVVNQLPESWKPLDSEVVISELTFIFPMLKGFSKKKYQQALNEEIKQAKQPDLDNLQKNLFDACNNLIWCDDSQIVEIRNIKKIYGEAPGIQMVVEGEYFIKKIPKLNKRKG